MVNFLLCKELIYRTYIQKHRGHLINSEHIHFHVSEICEHLADALWTLDVDTYHTDKLLLNASIPHVFLWWLCVRTYNDSLYIAKTLFRRY